MAGKTYSTPSGPTKAQRKLKRRFKNRKKKTTPVKNK